MKNMPVKIFKVQIFYVYLKSINSENDFYSDIIYVFWVLLISVLYRDYVLNVEICCYP